MENLFYTSKRLILIGLLFLFFSCSQDDLLNNDSPKTSSESLSNSELASKKDYIVFKGPEVEIGNGIVRSWFKVSKDEMPIEIGVEMTPGALAGLPDESDHSETIVVPLHLKAKQLTPFNHVGINWNPNGHPPPGVFDVPHFDIHFYMISVEDQLAIPAWSPSTDALFNNYPPPGYMPADYETPPGPATAEAQMGKHWLTTNLGAYLPFSKIMVYGSYNGEFTFIEPMVTLDYLLSNVDFSSPYSQPLYFEKAGYYPTVYNIRHDSETGNTNITLSGFVARVATSN